MATTKELKAHMKSIQDTQKITNAMYMIASMKMRKAKKELDKTRPYFEAVTNEITRALRTVDKVKSAFFFSEDHVPNNHGKERRAYLVITADKGLAGAYNQNVLKMAESELQDHEGALLYVVGEYGRQHFYRKKIEVEQNFLYTAQNPSMARAREICSVLVEQYLSKEINEVYVIYTDYKNNSVTEPVCTRLLPYEQGRFSVKKGEEEKTGEVSEKMRIPFEFFPSADEVLDELIPSITAGYIYSALVDSFCCEQEERMGAMASANDNAQEMIQSLRTQYNRIRQTAITQEITEVTAGARAIRNSQKL